MIQRYKDHLPEVDETCFLASGSAVIGDVKLCKNVSVWCNAVIRGDVARITIGDNTNIQDGSLLHCATGIELNIGSNVTVGHGVILHSCNIGDESLIGMGAIVLDGVVIGKHCLIGAGAVVTPNTVIPDGSLVLGSPARVKRELTEEEILHIKHNAQDYFRLGLEYKSET